MSEPIFPILETDPSELYNIAMARLKELVPDFDTDNISSPESWILEAVAEVAAEVQQTASLVPSEIFRYFGENFLGITPDDGNSSVARVRVTAADSLGHTIPEDTAFLLYTDGDTSYEFVSTADAVIPNGQTVIEFDVTCSSVGSDSNGAGVALVELVDSLTFASEVEIVSNAAGGIDAEDQEQYESKLRDSMELLNSRPITPYDFEKLARVTFGGRWLAMDTYSLPSDTWGVPRCLTLVGLTDDGGFFTLAENNTIKSFFENNREVNFLIYVTQPTTIPVDVECEIKIGVDYDPAEVLADVEAAIEDFFSLTTWGLPDGGDEAAWVGVDFVSYFKLGAAIADVNGVSTVPLLDLQNDQEDASLGDVYNVPVLNTLSVVVS